MLEYKHHTFSVKFKLTLISIEGTELHYLQPHHDSKNKQITHKSNLNFILNKIRTEKINKNKQSQC